MRLLLTAHSGASHLRALAPLAQLALRRGHDVLVASAPGSEAAVVAFGLPFAPVGRDWSEYAADVPQPGMCMLRGDLPGFTRAMYDGFHFGRPALEAARDAIDVARRYRPDVVVRESEDIAGYLAAEALEVPHVAVVSGNTHDLPADAQVPALDRLRAELGLPREPAGGGLYRHLLADLLPARYYGADVAGPTVARYRAANPDSSADVVPDWFAALDPAKPLVLASLGTVAPQLKSIADGALCDIVTALGELDCEAVVSVGLGRRPAALPVPAPHVRLVDTWLPQALLLDSVDLFVTHAGLGSVREAVRAGVPVVCVPQWDDQPYQADRCVALGTGRVVHRARRRAGDPEPIRAACAEVLDDPSYRRAASRLQRELLALPPLGRLLDDVEALAA